MSAQASLQEFSGRLTVDLGALVKNWKALDKVSANALTGAVLKSNAYGTGLAESGTALFNAGARFFFVATADEGIRLRAILPDAHIFILDGLFPGAAETYLAHRLMPSLASVPMLEEWLNVCADHNEAFPAALHFDTGMCRLGFTLNEVDAVRDRIEQFGYLPQMIMSHLACADIPSHEKNRTQLSLFQTIMAAFPGIPASLANSAGLMTGRDFHFQMVRPGIALYGGRAVQGRPNPMSTVVRLDVPILQIREAKTGETVGYGAQQSLSRDTRIAVVALGYADGFPWKLGSSNIRPGGVLAHNGRPVPIVGRVSMDLTAVDITDLGVPVYPGDMLEVLGPTISIDQQADVAGTIGYEILTSLKGRYNRMYLPAPSV